ncbi:hypothetical protein A1A1_00585 [Planococcus antarcticus DSM 14505]|uniref:Uncharacterized protein n=1 Tax=Planococcus antarcticus DSM 14505 TaxID=1185653 RepID=A0A1C7DCS6_9BACL|nr:hypothetical protein [Planococcus antarcticus]ANU09111.1 hypothetical protein BBH88_01580 [Planococcus antarcticus DSM 14505]EIM08547.1 hypothetical protein A1A1_00585 [Planococcus antarcticus DSM 14505]
MKKNITKNFIYTGTLMASSILLLTVYKKNRAKKIWVYEDNDMRNSVTVDHEESVNADLDEAEIGLTQLDSAYRSEWQANGFPQTHKAIAELENK